MFEWEHPVDNCEHIKLLYIRKKSTKSNIDSMFHKACFQMSASDFVNTKCSLCNISTLDHNHNLFGYFGINQ